MILTQGYLNKFEATGRKVQHLCPVQSFKVLTSLKDCLLHEGMILTCGLAGSRSLERKVQKSCLSHIFLETSSYFTQMLLFTFGFVSILTKGLLDKFNATRRKRAKFLSGIYLSNEKIDVYTVNQGWSFILKPSFTVSLTVYKFVEKTKDALYI